MASTPDTAVLATQRPRGPPPSTGGASQTQTTSSRPETKCTHCGGSKHIRAHCYELIGYPDILSSKTIGCGTRRGKLYYLDLASDSEASLSQAYKIGGTSVEKQTSENDRSQTSSDRSPDETNRSPDANDRSPRTLPESDQSPRTPTTLPESYRSPDPHDRSLPPFFSDIVPLQSDPSHHTQEERIEEFVPAPENSSAPVTHQSPAEDFIRVTSLLETDNINEITDCISEGAEPTYQIPKRKNRGKPPIHYEADLNAKGKYPTNNYVSLTRLSESRVHFVKQLADIHVPNSVTEALEDPK
ncbi:uncharacterized protein LOC110745835 [Prunus avium]|uniref:Uncharacterized protein LOC110745835 n=1 Tax=Prunus avium TaxID=42229 RepID=A0A6P5RIE6_PRUAV|nr:uncharacterized protein LOC110745835 [Prunus avium]